ncbi:hypothetical protein HDE_10927 [Halotydeus destructor]|nr:hypothetical protein HDE_10927 [Halotydeus destructor]
MNPYYASTDMNFDRSFDIYFDHHLDDYWATNGVSEYSDNIRDIDDTSETVLIDDDLEELKRGNYEIILFYPMASLKYFLMTLWTKFNAMTSSYIEL